MSRTYDYESWQRTRRGTTRVRAREAGVPRARRGRVRTPEEREMIAQTVLAEVRRREAEGRIVTLGPRKYELRP